jgi:hypothetical protein
MSGFNENSNKGISHEAKDGTILELEAIDGENTPGVEETVELELEPLPDGLYDVEPRAEAVGEETPEATTELASIAEVTDENIMAEAPFREGFDLAQDQADAMLINKKIDSMLANDESVNLEKLRNSPEDTVDRHLEKFREKKDEALKDTQLVESNQEAEENLAETVEKFEANLAALDQIPESVLNSPEGKEATLSLRDKMISKLTGFKDGLKEKLAAYSERDGEKIFAVLASLTGAAVVGPVLLQAARTKWPEVGVMLDAGPDMLQQFIHMDFYTRALELSGLIDVGELPNHSMWQNSNIEVNNLLADLSSGKETFDNLSPEQLELLQEEITIPDEFETLKHMNDNTEMWEKAASKIGFDDYGLDDRAEGMSLGPTMAKAFGNLATLAPAAALLGRVMYKVGLNSKVSK